MNQQTHYDNHANDIEYFNIHKPKIQIKKNKEDIREYSDERLLQRLDEVNIRLSGLYEIHEKTKSDKTLESITKLMNFRNAIKSEMRNRKVEPYHKLKEKVLDSGAASHEISNLRNQIEQLKKNLKEKEAEAKSIQNQLNQAKINLLCKKDEEKTKRHEINMMSNKPVIVYLLTFIKNTVTESEYSEVLSDIDEINQKETPH